MVQNHVRSIKILSLKRIEETPARSAKALRAFHLFLRAIACRLLLSLSLAKLRLFFSKFCPVAIDKPLIDMNFCEFKKYLEPC